jgi:hypothetical protein
MSLEEQIEAIVDKRIAEKQAPLIRQLEIANRVLAKIPLEVSTKEAMAMTDIKSPHTLKKHFTPTQDGLRGRVTYSRIEIETWLAERQLTKTA